LTLLFGLAAILLQTTALPALLGKSLELNLLFGMTIWMAFYKKQLDGVLLSFLLAFGQGAMSGVPSGIYLFAGMSLYLLCWFLRDRFAPKSLFGQFGFAMALGIFYKAVLLFTLGIFVDRNFFKAQPLWLAGLEILLNAAFAPLIFLVFNRLKGFYDLFPDVVQPRRG
jgi:hypothetical protein